MRERIVPAVVIAFGLIVAAFLSGGRYTVVQGPEPLVTRLDRFTGTVWLCGGEYDGGSGYGCVQVDDEPQLPSTSEQQKRPAASG